jgi:hypothetical protein
MILANREEVEIDGAGDETRSLKKPHAGIVAICRAKAVGEKRELHEWKSESWIEMNDL